MRQFLVRAFEDWTAGQRSPGLYLYGAAAKPCAWLYQGVAGVNWLRNRASVLPALVHSRLIVISSPLVGGVGKTPLAATIATGLLARNLKIGIVTLGYGRRDGGRFTLDDRRPLTTDQVGDEAVELWQRTRVPVHVGDDPSSVIGELDRRGNFDAIILDDGVSRRWEEEKRVVVFSADAIDRPVRFLPDGRWRTSPRMIGWATCVAITDPADLSADTQDRHRRQLSLWGFDGPVAWFRRSVDGIGRLGVDTSMDLDQRPVGSPFLFCGVGRPQRFLDQAASLGLNPGGFLVFPDHHRYTPRDLRRIHEMAMARGCHWLLTTHKDAVKLDPDWLGSTPVYFLRISLDQSAGDDLIGCLL